MASKDKVPTMVRLKPEIRSSLEIQAKQKKMSLSSFLESQLEGQQVTFNNCTFNMNNTNTYNYNPGSKSEKAGFVEVDYEVKVT